MRVRAPLEQVLNEYAPVQGAVYLKKLAFTAVPHPFKARS
jgi:hypothetical protein